MPDRQLQGGEITTANAPSGSVATGRIEGQPTFGLLQRQLAADALA
jgi:hypothetical protein